MAIKQKNAVHSIHLVKTPEQWILGHTRVFPIVDQAVRWKRLFSERGPLHFFYRFSLKKARIIMTSAAPTSATVATPNVPDSRFGSVLADILVLTAVLFVAYLMATLIGFSAFEVYGRAPSLVIMHVYLAGYALVCFLCRPQDAYGVMPMLTRAERDPAMKKVACLVAVFCVAVPVAVLGYDKAVHAVYRDLSLYQRIFLVIASCILAPVSEELLWRKTTYSLVRRYSLLSSYPVVLAVLYLLFTPIAFGFSHNNLFQAIIVLPLAAIMTAVYVATKSVVWSIAIHMLYNITCTVVTWLLRPTFRQLSDGEAELIWQAGIAVAIACSVGVVFVLRHALAREIHSFGQLPHRVIEGPSLSTPAPPHLHFTSSRL